MKALYLGLALSLLGGILGLIKSWKTKEEKKHKKENAVVIIGFILLLLGASQSFFSGKSAVNSKKISDSLSAKKEIENKRISDSLLAAQRYIIELQKEQNDTTKKILLNSNILILTQNEVNKLQNKLYDQSTGGNSFPFIGLRKAIGITKDDKFYFLIENNFDLPIYNITIQIFDFNALSSSSFTKKNEKGIFIKMDDYKKARLYEAELNELPARSSRMSEDLLNPKYSSFLIKINSRNRIVFQKLVIIQKGNDYYAGFSVFDTKGGILKEEIYGNPSSKIKGEIRAKLNEIVYIEYIFTD